MLDTNWRRRPTGGDEVWVHYSVVPIPPADGRPRGYLPAVTGISGRKQTQEEKERLLNAEREAGRNLADQTERPAR